MPTRKLSHSLFRKNVCLLCAHKSLRIIKHITYVQKKIVDAYKEDEYPEGICKTYRRKKSPLMIINWNCNRVKANTRQIRNLRLTFVR